ncbi:MAG: efflux RND transporter periplasmic adaptor subunit [Rhodospirillales bacterium]
MKLKLPARPGVLFVAIAVIATGALLYATFGGDASKTSSKRKGRPAPVLVAKVEIRSLPVKLLTIGSVQSKSTVAIKSRVDGQLLEAAFKEGQFVKQGDLLFKIDPRPFEAQLKQAEAALARNRAQLERAKSDLIRYEKLSKQGYSTQQKYEEAKASSAAFEASIRFDKAAIEMARLQLGFTEIRSPISGRTGSLLVNPGNLVKANDTSALVVVNEIKPIYVSFAVPEQHLAGIKARLAQSELKVEAAVPEDRLKPSAGVVSFLDNAVDTSTGTIQLKGTFMNEDERLTPGQFVNVSLILETLENAATVPAQAIQTGPKGTFVFVVKENDTVEVRDVSVALTLDETAAVKTGLTPGETVVTVGQLRLFDGKKVAVNKAGGQAGEGKKGKKKKDGDKKKQKKVKSDKPAKTVDESPAQSKSGPAS